MDKEFKINFINEYIKKNSNSFVEGKYDFLLKIEFDKDLKLSKISIKKYTEKEPGDLGYINTKLKIFFKEKTAILLKDKIESVWKE